MALSQFVTHQYTSTTFVESCGAILFDLSDPTTNRICLCKILSKNEYLLPKGRRNINETRKDAALREVYEETGYRCKLLPVMMATRATVPNDEADVRDEARTFEDLTESFMCTVRELSIEKGVKIIWWFIAVLDDENGERGPGEEEFRPEFFGCCEAVEKLSFEVDRDVLRKAIEIVDQTMVRDL